MNVHAILSAGLCAAGALVFAFAAEKPGKLGLIGFGVGLLELLVSVR